MRTVVLEKTLESSLDCKEIQPAHSEGDQPWDFFGRNDAKAETPVLWLPHVKSWLTGKDSDAGRDWGQEEKGTTEDEMAGWHHWLNGRESERTPGVGDGQGDLAWCDSWGHRVGHDWATEMNWTELNWGLHSPTQWPQPQVWVLNLWNMACLNWDVLQIWNNRFWRCRYSEYLMNICIPTVHIFCSCRLKW